MAGPDVPSPIDFHDPPQAAAWEADTIRRRPHRPAFFTVMAGAINAMGSGPVSLIEMGSGPGHLMERLLKDCKSGRYVAVDFSDAMHALARQRVPGSAVEFVTADFRSGDCFAGLPLVDVAVTQQSAHELRHTRHLRPWLTQLRSRLRPGRTAALRRPLFRAGHHQAPRSVPRPGRPSAGGARCRLPAADRTARPGRHDTYCCERVTRAPSAASVQSPTSAVPPRSPPPASSGGG